VVRFTPRPFYPGERASGAHRIGGWVGPRTGLDDAKKRKLLILTGFEHRHPSRPARSQSLYRLRYVALYYTLFPSIHICSFWLHHQNIRCLCPGHVLNVLCTALWLGFPYGCLFGLWRTWRNILDKICRQHKNIGGQLARLVESSKQNDVLVCSVVWHCILHRQGQVTDLRECYVMFLRSGVVIRIVVVDCLFRAQLSHRVLCI
jgi:hypothetical protein